MRRFATPLLLLFLLLVLFPHRAAAGYILHMKNERIMYVQNYEKDGDWMVLELGGKAKVRIKKSLIERIEEGKRRKEDMLKKSKSALKVEASTDRGGDRDESRSTRYVKERRSLDDEDDEGDARRSSRRLKRNRR